MTRAPPRLWCQPLGNRGGSLAAPLIMHIAGSRSRLPTAHCCTKPLPVLRRSAWAGRGLLVPSIPGAARWLSNCCRALPAGPDSPATPVGGGLWPSHSAPSEEVGAQQRCHSPARAVHVGAAASTAPTDFGSVAGQPVLVQGLLGAEGEPGAPQAAGAAGAACARQPTVKAPPSMPPRSPPLATLSAPSPMILAVGRTRRILAKGGPREPMTPDFHDLTYWRIPVAYSA